MTIIKSLKNIIYMPALFAMLFFMWGCSNYVKYVPVVLMVERGEHILVERSDLLTPRHVEAMKLILQKYDEKYKITDGQLYIEESLMNNKDLLKNYTFKAEVFLEK